MPKADFMNMMIATQRKVAMMELRIGTSVSLGHDNGYKKRLTVGFNHKARSLELSVGKTIRLVKKLGQ